jgi:hypothetical protein
MIAFRSDLGKPCTFTFEADGRALFTQYSLPTEKKSGSHSKTFFPRPLPRRPAPSAAQRNGINQNRNMKVTWHNKTGLYIGVLLLIDDSSNAWVRVGTRMHLVPETQILPLYS